MRRWLTKIWQRVEEFLLAPFENMTEEEIREMQRRITEQHNFPYDL